MDLDSEKMTQAVNLALNSHITMRQVRAGELSMWKGCSFANAARNGVFSALLAREGMTGPSPIFEGEMGFFKQVSGPFEMNIDDFGGKNGSFKIAETYLKFFPAEIHSQTSIWAALEARKEIEKPEDIVSVEIASHETGYTILGKNPEKWNPLTKETADHSLPYIVGMALLEGKIDNSTYSEKKFRDPKILDFLKKITVVEDKALSSMYPEAVANRVTVKLSSGKVVSKQVNYHKGHPKNPMSDQDVEEKFHRLTRKILDKNHARRILDAAWNLERAKDISKVVSMMTLRYALPFSSGPGIAETFSFPDVAVPPESQTPGVELDNLRMVDEEIHILSESFEVPFEDRRVRGLEHPGVVAELVHELLDHVLPPLARREIFCDAF